MAGGLDGDNRAEEACSMVGRGADGEKADGCTTSLVFHIGGALESQIF